MKFPRFRRKDGNDHPKKLRPRNNVPECVYGPPSWFGAEDKEPERPEDVIKPEENINACVYGPPEAFGMDSQSVTEILNEGFSMSPEDKSGDTGEGDGQ